MCRLIDADTAYEVLTDYYHHRLDEQHNALRDALSRVPTVDAVEVVRCKDCIYLASDNSCDIWSFYMTIEGAEKHYCSHGCKGVRKGK